MRPKLNCTNDPQMDTDYDDMTEEEYVEVCDDE